MTVTTGYIHGYSRAERQRLVAQAQTLAPIVFDGLDLPKQGRLLEIGCGVGAELGLIARDRPELQLIGVDLNASHLAAAADYLASIGQTRNALVLGDAFRLPFADEVFDCIITIWMLEHVADPRGVLSEARRLLRPGGRLICTEVDNHRFGFTPEQSDIMIWWDCFNRYQADRGGSPFVGAHLGEQVQDLGFARVETQSLYIIDTTRQPQRRLELLDYLRDLLLSGADQLIGEGCATEGQRQRMERQFAAARLLPDLQFFYYGIRLTCFVD